MKTQELSLQRVKEERGVADSAAHKNLPIEKLSRWKGCGSTHRFMAFSDKELVAYKLNEDLLPEILNTFKATDLKVSLTKGIESTWLDINGTELTIKGTPKEIAPGCFIWHPKHTTLELVSWNGNKSLKFSMLWRTELNPENKLFSKVYLQESATFKRSFKKAENGDNV